MGRGQNLSRQMLPLRMEGLQLFSRKKTGQKIVIEIKKRPGRLSEVSLFEKGPVRVVGPKELTGKTWAVKVISKQGSRR